MRFTSFVKTYSKIFFWDEFCYFAAFISGFLILFASNSFALTNESSELINTHDYSSYIDEKSYSPIQISDDYGILLTKSKVIDYHPEKLYQYYLNKICAGIYLVNCSYNKKNINTNLGIDLSSESGLISSSFSTISGYRVAYTTLSLDNQPHNVSGAILLPNSTQKLKGVIIFYRYTILDKNNIASNFYGDEFQLSRLVASTLVSAGYVVVMPDYLGMGDDVTSIHPYLLYPEVNALSGIYMLKLVEQIAPLSSFKLKAQQIPLFISGYSEGASYALWAAKILQENPNFLNKYGYKLTKTVPILGAYNLSKVTLPYVFSNVTVSHLAPYYLENYWVSSFVKPGLFANTMSAYAHYSLADQESLVFTQEFFDCKTCNLNGNKYNLFSWLQSAPARDEYKYSMINDAASSLGYGHSNNSVTPLANTQLASNPNFLAAVAKADIYNWQATTPISFLAFEYDSVVPRLNSETAYQAMVNKKSSWLKITRVPNQDFKVAGYLPWTDIDVDHPQGISLMLLFARKEFEEGESFVNNY